MLTTREETSAPIVAETRNVLSNNFMRYAAKIIAWDENSYLCLFDVPVAVYYYETLNVTSPWKKLFATQNIAKVEHLQFKRISETILAVTWNDVTYIYDILHSQEKFRYQHDYNDGRSAIIYCPESNEIITRIQMRITRISLKQKRDFDCGFDIEDKPVIRCHPGALVDLIFLPHVNGYVSSTLRARCDLEFWDENFVLLGKDSDRTLIRCLLAVPDSRYFLAGCEGGCLSLWDFDKRKVIHSLHICYSGIKELILLPDQKHIVVSAEKSLILVKINENSLSLVGLISDSVKCFTVTEQGEIDLIKIGSDKIERLTLKCVLDYQKNVRESLTKTLSKVSLDVCGIMTDYLFFRPKPVTAVEDKANVQLALFEKEGRRL